MQRNETLGSITRLVNNLRDVRLLTETALNVELEAAGVTFQILSENKHFLNGVWSGYEWDRGVEAFFWRKVLSWKPSPVSLDTVPAMEPEMSIGETTSVVYTPPIKTPEADFATLPIA